MNKHFISAVLAIALLSVFASLAPIGKAAAAWDKDICPCETAVYTFNLNNTQSSAESYYLAVDEFAKQAKFSENPVVVEPGKAKIAYAYITPKCDITGDYNFNFLIKNQGKTTKMPASLSIRPCPDFGISFGEMLEPEEKLEFSHHEGRYTICKGDSKKIPVLVINKGNLSNNLFFGIKGADFASLSQQSAALKEKQKGMISLNLEPGDIGNYSIFFDVTQERGEVKKTYKLDVESEECYKLSMDIEEETDKICSGETAYYDLKITNEGRFKESFNLSANAEWAGFDSSIIDIGPGEEGIAKLGLAPLVNDTGRYNLEVRASIVGTNVEDKDMISIKVLPRESCYSAKIIANNLYGIDSFGKKIALKIKNTGIKEADFDITLEGPAWASISQNKISLAEGETKGLNIFAKPGTDTALGTYNLSVTLKKDELSYSKNITMELSNQEQILSKLKIYFNYYIYYAITGIVLLILVLVIATSLKRAKKAMPKQKRPTKDGREELREEAKKEQKKKAEKKAEQKKEGKGTSSLSSFLKAAGIIMAVLVIIGITAYLFERFKLFDHIQIYMPFIGAGAGLLIIIILTLNFARKRPKKAEKTKEREQKEKATGAKLKKIEKGAEAKARPEKKEAKEKSHIIEFVQYMLILAVLGAVIYFISRVGGVKSALVYYLNYAVLGFALLVILIMILNKFRRIKGKGGKAKKGEKEAKKEEKIAVKKEDGKAEKRAEKKRSAKPDYFKYLFWSGVIVILGLFFLSYAFHNLITSWLSAPYGYAKEFVLLYFEYIIVGFIILAILILLLKYRRKFLDFLMEDDEEKEEEKRN